NVAPAVELAPHGREHGEHLAVDQINGNRPEEQADDRPARLRSQHRVELRHVCLVRIGRKAGSVSGPPHQLSSGRPDGQTTTRLPVAPCYADGWSGTHCREAADCCTPASTCLTARPSRKFGWNSSSFVSASRSAASVAMKLCS